MLKAPPCLQEGALQFCRYMLSLAHHVSNKEKADNHKKEPKP